MPHSHCPARWTTTMAVLMCFAVRPTPSLAQGPAAGPSKVAKERAQLVEQQVEQTEKAVSGLKDRLDPLQERVQQMLDQVSTIAPDEEEEAEKPKEKKAKIVEFRPPLAYISNKQESVAVVCENGRATLLDFKAINDAIKPGIDNEILPKVRQGQKGPWDGTWKATEGAFDVKYLIDINKNTIRLELVRKSSDRGETLAELAREDSVVGRIIRQADTSKTLMQCAVYPDSFEVFRAVRKLGWGKKMEVGWVPLPSGQPILLGSGSGVRVGG